MNETYVHVAKDQDLLTVHVVRQARSEEDEAKVDPTPHPPVLSWSSQFQKSVWNNEPDLGSVISHVWFCPDLCRLEQWTNTPTEPLILAAGNNSLDGIPAKFLGL